MTHLMAILSPYGELVADHGSLSHSKLQLDHLRAQAGRASARGEPDLAQRLRRRADLLDARLVDPLWRTFAARALQVAA